MNLDAFKRDREEFKRKKKEKAERERQKAMDLMRKDPSVMAEIAKEVIARGFLTEALARNKRTTRAGDFYKSKAWASARYAALLKADGACKCCGARASDGATLHVDHIKPRSKFPDLALELSNLQVLCDLCNVAKTNIDMTDWTAPKEDTGAEYRKYKEEERNVFRVLKAMR